jgi:electron transfer flavoprotein beta subunit
MGASVLVCIKRVVDSSGEVVLTEDAQAVDGRFAGFTTSAHEECAIELATQVASATDGSAAVLTLGEADAVEQLRTALALGCTSATHVVTDPSLLGPADVAREIAAVVRDHAAAGEVHDLVLLGNDAADSGDFQVGIRLAYELGWPVVNGVSTLTVEGDEVVASGEGPDGRETYRVALPAVVTVLEGGVEPRYPGVPGRLRAKKIPIEERTLSAEPTGPNRVRLLLPPAQPSDVRILGTGAGAAPAVVDLLESLGVLSR